MSIINVKKQAFQVTAVTLKQRKYKRLSTTLQMEIQYYFLAVTM